MAAPDDEGRERFSLSVAQVSASSLAAMSAAVVCSFFGVAGTVIGTAITSLVATVGGALYSYSFRRTQARLRRLHKAGAASPPVREVLKTAREQGRQMLGQIPWRLIGLGTGCVFVLSIGVITAIEESQGETLAALFHVSHRSDRACSLCAVVDGHHAHHHKAKPTPSMSPSPTPSVAPTRSSSPSPSPSGSSSSSPTPTPTAVPSTSPPVLPLPPLGPTG